MLKNKSTKQERSNYSNGIHAYSVIKKLKEINTFWRASNSSALARERIHLPPVPTSAKGSVVNGVLCLCYLALLICFPWHTFIKKIQEKFKNYLNEISYKLKL